MRPCVPAVPASSSTPSSGSSACASAPQPPSTKTSSPASIPTTKWGSAESRSGGGSTRERGAHFRDALLDLLDRFAIASIIDAPCGDFNWMREVVSGRHTYTGIDIVEELIAANREHHGAPNRMFLCGDLTRDALPKADLIFCRDCLVHFSYADIRAAIANFKRSGAKYLLTTTFPGAVNVDIRTGGWRPINLEAEPFHFPPPLATIDEVPANVKHDYPDKKLSLWEVSSLCLSPGTTSTPPASGPSGPR